MPSPTVLLKNELRRISCPSCNRFVARFFKRPKMEELDEDCSIEERIGQMQKMKSKFIKMNAKSDNTIDTPHYRIMFSTEHASSLSSSNLAEQDYRTRCDVKAFISSDPISVVYRVLSRLKLVRNACIVNAIQPHTIRDWLESADEDDLSTMLSPLLRARAVDEIGMAIGVVESKLISADFSAADENIMIPLGMEEWANQVDSSSQGHGYYQNNSEHNSIVYSSRTYRGDNIIKMSKADFDALGSRGYGKIAKIKAGIKDKPINISLQYCEDTIKDSELGKLLLNGSIPGEFWMIDPQRVLGRSDPHQAVVL